MESKRLLAPPRGPEVLFHSWCFTASLFEILRVESRGRIYRAARGLREFTHVESSVRARARARSSPPRVEEERKEDKGRRIGSGGGNEETKRHWSEGQRQQSACKRRGSERRKVGVDEGTSTRARRDHEAMHPRQEHRPASSSSTSSTSSNCLRSLPPLAALDSPGMIARLFGANAALLFLLLFLVTVHTAVCLDPVPVSI